MSEQIIKTIMALPNGLTIKAFDGDEFEWNGVLDCTSGDLKDLTAELEAANKKLEMARAFIERMADGDFAWIGDASVTARQALAAIQAEGGK
jgi:hypothetical protein